MGPVAITSEPDRPAPRKEVPRQTARILVVDDIEDNRDLLVRRLRREGVGSPGTELEFAL